MKIKLIIDSVSDLPIDFKFKDDITIVPLSVNFENETYKDGIELNSKDFFEKLKKSKKLPTTSQVNPGEFIEIFEKELKEYDHLIVITLSSKMSGTYSAAVSAKEYLDSDKITIIDSEGVSFGFGMICMEVLTLIKEGKDLNYILKEVDLLKSKIVNIIIVDTLEYLQKGGRLTAAEAFIGSMLKLKPILTIKNGSLIPVDKVRGRKKAISWVFKYLSDNEIDLNNKKVGVYNASDADFMDEIIDEIIGKYPLAKIIKSEVGSVVGTHSGPGAIGISFFL